jgi:hypothetical protein
MSTNEIDITVRVKQDDAARALAGLSKSVETFSLDVSKASDQASKGFGGIGSSILSITGGMVSATAITSGLSSAFKYVASTAIGMNSSLETSTLQFQTLMGDAGKAKEHVKGLFDFAAKTPFEVGPIIAASKTLQVFGGEALNSTKNLTLVGDAAAATGAPIEEVSSWVGKMYANFAAGKKDIGEAAARLTELGVIGPQARAALEQVAAGGGTVEQKFKVMQDALGKFGGAMETQAGTWRGVMSTFSAGIGLAIANGFKPLFEAARDAMGSINDLMKTDTFSVWADGLKTATAGIADALRKLPLALVGVTGAFLEVKSFLIEFVTDFVSLGGKMNQAVADMMAPFTSLPGISGQLAGTIFGKASSEAQNATEMLGPLGLMLKETKESLGATQLKAISLALGIKDTGTAAGGATGPNKTFGDTLGSVGDKAGKASAKLKEYLGVVQQLPGAVSFGASSIGTTGQFIGGSFNPAGTFGRAGNAQNPFGGVFGSGLTGSLAALVPGTTTGLPDALGQLVDADPNLSAALAAIGYVSGKKTGTGTAGKVFGGLGTSFLGNLSGVVQAAFQGGGSLGKSIGGLAGSSLGGMAGGAISSAMKGLGGLGPALMGALGQALPGLGALVGPMIGNLFGKLFGPSKGKVLGQEADARIGQTQAGLLQQYGSLDAIRASGSAGAALADAWGSKNVAGEQHFNDLLATFEKQNGLLEKQKGIETQIADQEARRKSILDSLVPTADQLASITDKYKINTDGLGTTFNQIGATDAWTKMLNDIQAMDRAGADAGGMLVGMQEEISALVNESLALGTTVPENMRPYIEELAKSGRLLDASGNKITTLAGIKWGQPVETEADKAEKAISDIDQITQTLKDSLLEVVDALKNLLPQAAKDGAAGVANVTWPTVRIPKEYYDVNDGSGDTGYAEGGLVTSPQRAWVGEGGEAELVGPVSFMSRALAGALRQVGVAGGVGGAVIQPAPVIIDGREIARINFRYLPRELQAAGVLR